MVHKAVVEALGSVVASLEVVATAVFVTQTPENDARVITVAQNHTLHAVDESRNPRRHIANRLIGMVFEVSLVHHIESIVVEHSIHFGGIRIVRSANGVDIVALHEEHILEHTFGVDSATEQRVSVVAVNTLEEHPLTIDVNQRTALLNLAEAIFGRESHFLLSVLALHHSHGVEIGCFGSPRLEVLEIELHLSLSHRRLCRVVDANRFLSHQAFGVVVNLHHDIFFALQAVAVVEREVNGHRTGSVARSSRQARRDYMVAHAHLRHIIEIYIAENATHAEHVLTLQVRAVAPAEHLNGEAVAARAEIFGEVELSHIVGTLRVAHIFAVEVDQSSAVDATEVNESALLSPIGGQVEEAHIRAHGVDAIIGAAIVESTASADEWRSVAVRIFHIAIYRAVVAMHFPVGRHRDGVPAAHVVVLGIETHGTHRRFGNEVEIPGAIEQHSALTLGVSPRESIVLGVGGHSILVGVGSESGVPRLLVFGETRFVLPDRLFALIEVQAIVESEVSSHDTEKSSVRLGSLCGIGHHHLRALHGSRPFSVVRRHELHRFAHAIGEPKLHFIGAVGFGHSSAGSVVGAHRNARIGIREAEAAREFADGPELVFVGFVHAFQDYLPAGAIKSEHLVGVKHRHNLIDATLVEALLSAYLQRNHHSQQC